MRVDVEAKSAKKLAEKEAEIFALVARCALLMNENDKKKVNDQGPGSSHNNDEYDEYDERDEHNTMSPKDIKTMIAEGIKQF